MEKRKLELLKQAGRGNDIMVTIREVEGLTQVWRAGHYKASRKQRCIKARVPLNSLSMCVFDHKQIQMQPVTQV